MKPATHAALSSSAGPPTETRVAREVLTTQITCTGSVASSLFETSPSSITVVGTAGRHTIPGSFSDLVHLTPTTFAVGHRDSSVRIYDASALMAVPKRPREAGLVDVPPPAPRICCDM